MNKLLHPEQTGKILENSTIIRLTGCYLLLGIMLFLYPKTSHVFAVYVRKKRGLLLPISKLKISVY
jgi:hypothetical protein